MSLVEVSPSTLMQLKVVAACAASRSCSTGAAMAASVKMKQSIVAMSGAIMPAPLQNPLRITGTPPIYRARGELGVGVGRQDRARGGLDRVGLGGGGEPAEQVGEAACVQRLPDHARRGHEHLLAAHPAAAAAAATVVSTAWRPFMPVKALALPELTTRMRAQPCFQASRHHSTGAELVFERVSTPATAVPGSMTATMRSVRPR